ASHDRVMILEVMGRDAGFIALEAGIAGGADVILIPEIEFKIDNIVAKIKELQATGMNYARIIVSEAARMEDGKLAMVDQGKDQIRYGGIGDYIKRSIEDDLEADVRVQVLGHTQRGGSPTWNDRLLAKMLGVKAVDLIDQGKFGYMAAFKDGKITEVSVEQAVSGSRTVDPNGSLVHTAKSLGIYLGD
ncbi:MAG: 6-phosphofructokinase, partial [Pseudomonadota bacterium]